MKLIVVLVKVYECLTTHEKRAKSLSQAKSTGPLLQRHSQKLKQLCPAAKKPLLLPEVNLSHNSVKFF